MQEEQRSMRESLRVQRRLWRVLLLIAGLACCVAVPAISHAKYIKAVTYFGNAWPLNY